MYICTHMYDDTSVICDDDSGLEGTEFLMRYIYMYM
jgi:hypothetical protein